MKKTGIFLLLTAASAFVLACSGQAAPGPEEKPDVLFQITTAVNADGSGDMTYHIELSKAILSFLKGLPDFPKYGKVCEEFKLNIEGGGEWTETEGDGAVICNTVISFTDLEEYETLVADLFYGANFSRLEIADDRFYYDLKADMASSYDLMESLPYEIEVWWIVEVPGAVVNSNADTTSGRTLTWNVMALDPSAHITAESRIGGMLGMDPVVMAVVAVLLLGCCGVVVLIAGVAGFFLLRKK